MSTSPLVWPPYATDPSAPAGRWISGLGESQAWTAARLQAGQHRQLQALAQWSVQNVPFYRAARWRDPLKAAATADAQGFAQRWRDVPILTKPELRKHGPKLYAQSLPASEKPHDNLRTSGSTGIPVEIRRSATARAMWLALTLRETYWVQRNVHGVLGVARHLPKERRSEAGQMFPDWGPPYSPLHTTGQRAVIHVGYPLDVLDRWLDTVKPHVLLTYPSVLAGLLELRGERGPPPRLAEASLISEPVSPELQQRLAFDWNVRTSQSYSAIDGGYIALQCEKGKLHVQSEAVHVELLREDGAPCAVGETGRVVITPLHNLATPLLRYAIGDYAVAGKPCVCGREHPVLDQVLGRERNLLRRPDGSTGWPSSLRQVVKVPAVLQAQYVQTALDRIELRVKLSRPLKEGEREQLVAIVQRILYYPFEVDVVPVDSIERGPTGKFEEFVSKLPDKAPAATGA